MNDDVRFFYYAMIFAPLFSLAFCVSAFALELQDERGLSIAMLFLMACSLAILIHASDELLKLLDEYSGPHDPPGGRNNPTAGAQTSAGCFFVTLWG